MNRIEITEWLNSYSVKNFTINEDLSVDVHGNLNLYDMKLTSIPVNFRNVSGHFSAYHNKLSSLANCPRVVGGGFSCSNNNLTSLEYCPEKVGGNFFCSYNNLTYLEHSPKLVGGNFYIGDIKLPCSEDMSKWLISRNKNGVDIIYKPSQNMLTLHKMLWEI